MTDEPRPFDPFDIASRIKGGHRVQLGPHLLLCLDDGDYTATCTRCAVVQRVPFRSTAIALLVEECAQFVVKHSHQEPSS